MGNRLNFGSPRVSSFLGLRLVKTRHKNLVPLLSGVKPDPMVGSGRYAEPIPVKSPLTQDSPNNMRALSVKLAPCLCNYETIRMEL